jgi:prepilin-type N-terminal cleavage/methylation domain-containing protein
MNRRGITLIELVVVIVIIAIGAVLTAPNIGAWIPTYRLKSAAGDIVSMLRVAQAKAVSSNAMYRVSFDLVGSSYVLQYQGSGGLWLNDGGSQALPKGVQFNTTFVGNLATFYPNSSATDGSITLLNAKGAQKSIRVWGTTGRIKNG